MRFTTSSRSSPKLYSDSGVLICQGQMGTNSWVPALPAVSCASPGGLTPPGPPAAPRGGHKAPPAQGTGGAFRG
eukprot:9778104-Alexandrium_andersonii.AAC.1